MACGALPPLFFTAAGCIAHPRLCYATGNPSRIRSDSKTSEHVKFRCTILLGITRSERCKLGKRGLPLSKSSTESNKPSFALPSNEEQFKKLVDVISRSQHNYRELIDSLDQAVF